MSNVIVNAPFLRRAVLVVGALQLLQPAALAQTTPSPISHVAVSEYEELNLGEIGPARQSGLPGSGRMTAAKAGTRFVTVRLELDQSITKLQSGDVVLTDDSGRIYTALAMGPEDGELCPSPGPDLERTGQAFTGVCVSRSGGFVTVRKVSVEQPTVAFAVERSVALKLLQVSLGVLVRAVPVGTTEAVLLPNGLVVKIIETTLLPGDLPFGPAEDRRLAVVFVEVINTGRSAFRMHAGTVRLHVPSPDAAQAQSLEAERAGEQVQLFGMQPQSRPGTAAWQWLPSVLWAADMTGVTVGAHRDGKGQPLMVLAPSSKRMLGLSFDVGGSVDIKRSELGFFREHVRRLVPATTRQLPSKKLPAP